MNRGGQPAVVMTGAARGPAESIPVAGRDSAALVLLKKLPAERTFSPLGRCIAHVDPGKSYHA
jgi:hypothetical protein